MLSNALDIRKGYLVSHQGRMCTVADWSIMRNDRRQYIFVTLKDLQTGRITELKEHGDTKFEVLEKETIELTHSYSDGNEEVFYDPQGVEFRCPKEAASDALLWPAESYVGLVVSEKLVSITPPNSVILRVKETAPPLKGGNNSFKDAVLENGIKLKVSQLVATGERVRVDPLAVEFRERIGP